MDIAEIAKIAIPSLVTLIVPFVTYRWITRKLADYQTDLSKEIEDYKKEISKEIENYKFQLQSDFQTKFYEFQTRYSFFYRERAEVIKKIYALLKKMQSILLQSYFDSVLETEIFDPDNLIKQFEELTDYIDANQILLHEEVLDRLKPLTGEMGQMLLAIGEIRENNEFSKSIAENREYKLSEFRERWKIAEIVYTPVEALEVVNTKIPNLMKLLEKEFREILSVENPNNELEKRQ